MQHPIEPSVLVVGGTGTIGSEVVRRLVARETDVRALTRTPSKAGWMEDLGVEVVEGDLGDPASLDAALTSVEEAFLLSDASRDLVELQSNFVEAAERADLGHLVKLSAAGADPDATIPIDRWHGEVEERIEESGLEYTHLRPVYLMQNLLRFAESIGRDGAFFQATPGERSLSMVDARDVASVAATVLAEDGHDGEAYLLTGPETLTFTRVAAILSEAIGTDVAYEALPPGTVRERIVGLGQPAWLADVLVALQVAYGEGAGSAVTDTVESVTGSPPRSFEAFARDHAARFRAHRIDA